MIGGGKEKEAGQEGSERGDVRKEDEERNVLSGGDDKRRQDVKCNMK